MRHEQEEHELGTKNQHRHLFIRRGPSLRIPVTQVRAGKYKAARKRSGELEQTKEEDRGQETKTRQGDQAAGATGVFFLKGLPDVRESRPHWSVKS